MCTRLGPLGAIVVQAIKRMVQEVWMATSMGAMRSRGRGDCRMCFSVSELVIFWGVAKSNYEAGLTLCGPLGHVILQLKLARWQLGSVAFTRIRRNGACLDLRHRSPRR